MSKIIVYIVIFQVINFLSVTSFTAGKCSEGPSYWCKDYNTATECGVRAFCELKNKKTKITNSDDDDNQKEATQLKEHLPVKIELYYETYCPACKFFITGQLWQTFLKLKNSKIMDISLYPYGNAEETKVGNEYKFQCQHGVKECQMNLLETCALHLLAHPDLFMPFINCVEQNPSLQNAEECAKQLELEWDPIFKCYNGSEGNYLQHQMAAKTDLLNPSHQYVPWIVVNGEHTERMQNAAMENLLKFVCLKYTAIKPHVCRVAISTEDRCYKRN